MLHPIRCNYARCIGDYAYARGILGCGSALMAVLDPATVLALAVQCAPIGVDPNLVLALARTESGLNSTAKHINANGSIDVGLMQVNSANFAWLGLTEDGALDPCQSIRAGVRVLTSVSAYNTGNQIAGFHNGYVGRFISTYSHKSIGIREIHDAEHPQLTLSEQIATPSNNRVLAFTLPPERKR